MTEDKPVEFDIHAQEATTIKLLDGNHVMIDQEAPDEQFGIVSISIRGPANLEQLITALQKCRETMV